MTPPVLKPCISSADIQIIREELLFEKFCVKADVYRTPDNTSQITITHISLLLYYNNKEVQL